MKIFPPALWALFALILVAGYTAGFVAGSLAIDSGIRRTIQYLEHKK